MDRNRQSGSCRRRRHRVFHSPEFPQGSIGIRSGLYKHTIGIGEWRGILLRIHPASISKKNTSIVGFDWL